MNFKVLTSDGDTHSTHKSLKDAIDQADMIHGSVGVTNVLATDGETTGVITQISSSGGVATIESGGSLTNCDVDDIHALGN